MKNKILLLLNILSVCLTIYYLIEGNPDGMQMAFIGNIIRAIGSNKQRKRLEKERRKAGTIADRMAEIDKYKPDFEVDRSGMDAFTEAMQSEVGRADQEVSRATYNKVTAGGRPAGDELARDENRRTTANTVGQALQTVGGGSDALAALAMADAQERTGNRRIDAMTAEQIQRNEQIAEGNRQRSVGGRAAAGNAYAQALMQDAQFDTDADILEYQENQLNPYLQAVSDERALDAGINQARGQTWESFAGIGDDLFSLGTAAFSAGLTGGVGGLFGGGGAGVAEQVARGAVSGGVAGLSKKYQQQAQMYPYLSGQ